MIAVAAIFHSKNSCKRNKETFENNSFSRSRRKPRSVETIDQSNTFQAILENRLLATNNKTSIPTATRVDIASNVSILRVREPLSHLKLNSSIHSALPVDDNNRGADHNGNQI